MECRFGSLIAVISSLGSCCNRGQLFYSFSLSIHRKFFGFIVGRHIKVRKSITTMELENLKLKCECGGMMKRIATTWRNIPVRGWRCASCGEELIHPGDAQQASEAQRKAEEKQRLESLMQALEEAIGKSQALEPFKDH